MNCINLSQFIAYQNGKLTPKDHDEVREHIETCSVCQINSEKYENFLSLFKQSFQPSYSKDISHCYNDSDLLEFIEVRHPKKLRTKFYSHLLECQSCMDRTLSLYHDLNELRQEGVLAILETPWDKVRRFISNLGAHSIEKFNRLWTITGSLKPAYGWVGLILILCISMITIITLNSSSKKEIITRDNKFDVAQWEVQLIQPENNSRLNIHEATFQWNAPEKALNYNFFLLDDRGNILWETSTKGRRLELPDNITLNNNQRYFWQVEAIFENGASRLSPMLSFIHVLE